MTLPDHKTNQQRPPRSAQTVALDVFQALYKLYVEDADGEVTTFVGLQGDAVVLMQAGGEHLAVKVIPASVAVSGAES